MLFKEFSSFSGGSVNGSKGEGTGDKGAYPLPELADATSPGGERAAQYSLPPLEDEDPEPKIPLRVLAHISSTIGQAVGVMVVFCCGEPISREPQKKMQPPELEPEPQPAGNMCPSSSMLEMGLPAPKV